MNKNILGYTINDAQSILNVSHYVVIGMLRRGSLRTNKDGSITKESVDEILERQKIPKPVWIHHGSADLL